VLAGGKGTRLNAVTNGRPKILAPLLGRPFLHWKLEQLANQGVDEVILLLGNGFEDVLRDLKDYIPDNPAIPSIKWIVDAVPNTGTGGALINALDGLPEFFTLTYGDNLLNFPLRRLWKINETTMVVTSIGDSDLHLNVWIEGNNIVDYSKSQNKLGAQFLDYGYCRFKKSDLDMFPKKGNQIDLEQIFSFMIKNQKLGYLETQEKWFEIGSPESLRATERDLSIGAIGGLNP
jgi:NDP-sugar pyrophosphorylase family protein